MNSRDSQWKIISYNGNWNDNDGAIKSLKCNMRFFPFYILFFYYYLKSKIYARVPNKKINFLICYANNWKIAAIQKISRDSFDGRRRMAMNSSIRPLLSDCKRASPPIHHHDDDLKRSFCPVLLSDFVFFLFFSIKCSPPYPLPTFAIQRIRPYFFAFWLLLLYWVFFMLHGQLNFSFLWPTTTMLLEMRKWLGKESWSWMRKLLKNLFSKEGNSRKY